MDWKFLISAVWNWINVFRCLLRGCVKWSREVSTIVIETTPNHQSDHDWWLRNISLQHNRSSTIDYPHSCHALYTSSNWKMARCARFQILFNRLSSEIFAYSKLILFVCVCFVDERNLREKIRFARILRVWQNCGDWWIINHRRWWGWCGGVGDFERKFCVCEMTLLV
jgi:hypothetical protein